MATIKDLLSSMIRKINSKVSTWEELPDKPFGMQTEMVEVVPEQSVTGTLYPNYNMYDAYNLSTSISYEDIYKPEILIVMFNGVRYDCPAEGSDDEISYGNRTHNGWKDYPFCVRPSPDHIQQIPDYSISWNPEFGETITLAIYEEQEVVQQIDPKFVGSGAVNLYQEIEKLGFILIDEENDWYFEDDLYDTGEYRQTIPFNEPSFKKFLNTVNNTVVGMFKAINIGYIADGDVYQCEFSYVFPSGDGIGLYVYNVEVHKAEDSDNLELYISQQSAFVHNS